MKAKRYSVFVAILFTGLFLLSACGCEHQYNSGEVTKEATCVETGVKTYTCELCGSTKTEEIPLGDHQYTSEVTKEPTYKEVGETKYTCSICGDSYTEEIPTKQLPVEFKILEKKAVPEDIDNYIFYPRVDITVSFTNFTDKDIKGVSGKMISKDMFGKELITSDCDLPSVIIPAKQEITLELCMDVDTLSREQVTYYNTPLEDLEYEFVLSMVVYSDGTKEQF